MPRMLLFFLFLSLILCTGQAEKVLRGAEHFLPVSSSSRIPHHELTSSRHDIN